MSFADPNGAALLRQAKDLIADPGCWIREVMARDAVGNVVGPRERRARCFCIIGTLERTARPCRNSLEAALEAELPAPHARIPAFNDHPSTRHKDVMALFDRAIAKMEGGR